MTGRHTSLKEMTMNDMVKLEQVHKVYGHNGMEVRALRRVDLALETGEFTVVMGPSGSGKSTLLNLIGVLDRPTEGRVLIDGEDTTDLSPSKLSRLRLTKIGFVFQAYNLIPVLTAYENAEYVLMLQGRSAVERREKIMGLLKTVGLEGMEHRFPRELSGGQQQRVAIARAIAPEPDLVLADEPTANLDSKTASSLLDLMARLNEEKGATFLFSTHDPQVMKRARRTIVLHDGEVAEDREGPAAEE
jgi:putative ABC transport system ATP-binding protein